ncbi:IclR family transcriptional regulator [Georgenia sp. Z1491]|uniref:IclR family transcriptional regulator n=1 Tax=Georgenia sp. Z1491 TaxID=3416707 RepID=UPI003CEDC2BA
MATPGESVISRVVRVLEAFQSDESELSVAAIARSSRLPIPSAHRIVNELIRWELLERTDTRRIRIGLRLWELAVRNSPQTELRDRALPFLEGLQSAVRQHTQLSVLRGTDVVYIENLRAPEPTAISILKLAGRLPAATCSAGIVFAAFGTDAEREAILGAIPRPLTSASPTRTDDIWAAIEAGRRSGVCAIEGWIHPDVTGLAAPIRDQHDEVVAAVSVLVPRDSALADNARPAVRATAHGISRALHTERTRDPELLLLEYMVRQGTSDAHGGQQQ